VTTPVERTRALLWAGAFLIEVARDKKLPLRLRRQAVVIARHFPTVEDVSAMSLTPPEPILGPMLASPDEIPAETDAERFGRLRYSTRLGWPEEG
jgi:hypothetical protein